MTTIGIISTSVHWREQCKSPEREHHKTKTANCSPRDGASPGRKSPAPADQREVKSPNERAPHYLWIAFDFEAWRVMHNDRHQHQSEREEEESNRQRASRDAF